MKFQFHSALFVLIRHRRIRTCKMFEHGEVRHVPIASYLKFRLGF